MPAASSRRRAVLAAAVALALAVGAAAACTRSPDPGPVGLAGRPPVRLSVASIEVRDQVAGVPLNFIDRRRTDEMLAATKAYLTQRFQAAGGADFGRATVEQATLVERPVPRGGVTGVITGPASQLVGGLAVRVAVVDALGVEKAYARTRVELKRPVPDTASVVERDRLARDLTNDLLRAVDDSLQPAVRENLGAYLATS